MNQTASTIPADADLSFLPDEERTVIELRRTMTLREVAARLGISHGHVRGLQVRAERRYRNLIASKTR